MEFNTDMTCEELGEFLQLSGLQDDIVSSVMQHKVSGETFLELTEGDLKELIPNIGDRITIRKLLRALREVSNTMQASYCCVYSDYNEFFYHVTQYLFSCAG